MLLPAFFFMTVVEIHSPTPKMWFYQCNFLGPVLDYRLSEDSTSMDYMIALDCPASKLSITEWIKEGNLREYLGEIP